MRLFTAIELPEDVRSHLASLGESVKRNAGFGGRSVSFTRPENLHVTLKFLGEVPEGEVPSVCDALRAVPVDGPIHVRANGFELFPPRGPVRVITAGLDGDVGALKLLAGAIENACEPLGFPPERREYRAHVTLARARDPLPAHVREDLSSDLRKHFPGPPFQVNGFTLFESRLRPGGPEYARLAEFTR
jgi:2'-5' RNA ligase